MATKRLTGMQHLFALEYVICKNGTEAARRAGYAGDDNSLAVTASRLLRNAKVIEYIDSCFAETSMRANEVIARTSDIAAGDMSDFIEIKHGVPFWDFDKAKARNKMHLVKKFKTTPKGVELELYDAQAAQHTLAQHHGLLKSGIEINIKIELVVETIKALEDAGIDATEFFQKAKEQAEQRVNRLG